LAVAICHTHHSQSEARIEAAELAMTQRRA
jgi:hypothetical protein